MRNVALIHASRAAVDPVTQYYSAQAPELELTNLLDDGVMRMLRKGDFDAASTRLSEMLALARQTYQAEVALLTCSAVPVERLEELRRSAGMKVLKIDEPMCEAAVASGARIGVITTFPPTSATTRGLLAGAAGRAGKTIEIVEELVPEALKALLAGDEAAHDAELLQAAERLAGRRPEVVVLAQVSMARLSQQVSARVGVPVLSSLASSLEAIRAILNG